MSKAILISIKPKWVAKILNGEKTVEIRKSIPKYDLPIDVYIYCTKDKKYANLINRGGFLTGMVVAKFTLNKVDLIRIRFNAYCGGELSQDGLCKYACLSLEELDRYLNAKNGYAWHIDNLVIFDRPKELKEFYVYSHSVSGIGLDGEDKTFEILKPLTKAPQSYCFIRDVL